MPEEVNEIKKPAGASDPAATNTEKKPAISSGTEENSPPNVKLEPRQNEAAQSVAAPSAKTIPAVAAIRAGDTGPVSASAPPRSVPLGPDHSEIMLPAEALPDAEAEKRIRRMSRRSFMWGAAAVAGTYLGIQWLGTRRTEQGIAWPFRRALEVNENLSRDLFSAHRLAPEFPKNMAQMPRQNGDYGVADAETPDWKLHLIGLADMSSAETPSDAPDDAAAADSSDKKAPPDKKAPAGDKKAPAGDKKAPAADKKGGADAAADSSDDNSDSADASASDSNDGGDASDDSSSDASPSADTAMAAEPAVMVSLADIKSLPRTEIVTELKCIEGWSTIVHWAGVRFLDFMKKYPPATKSGNKFDPNNLSDLPEFVSLETPDGVYYVGLEMASALHPQTLLCYEMNGKPIAPEHGAPLRLAIPVKYGIKNIKNIGTIKFTDLRPRDYWAEQGYDWYAGH